MPQRSLPQDGISPSVLDGGPYNAAYESRRDATLSKPKFTGFAATYTTTATTITLNIAPGQGIVDGTWFNSSDTMTFNLNWAHIPSVANGIVGVHLIAVNNRSGSPVTQIGSPLNNLFFPTVLVDYNSVASVPDNSIRLAVVVSNNKDFHSPTYLANSPGVLYNQIIGTVLWDLSGAGAISNPIRIRAPQEFDSYALALTNSTIANGLVSLTVPASNLSRYIISGRIFVPMRGYVGANSNQLLNLNLDIDQSPVVFGAQAVYINDATVPDLGDVGKFNLSHGNTNTWPVCIFDIVCTRHYNYTMLTGQISHMMSGANNQGIIARAGNEAIRQKIVGIIYGGTDPAFQVRDIILTESTGRLTIGANSVLGIRRI